MGLYKVVRNRVDGQIYHVSTMQHPVLGWWETAVFPDPGPAYGVQSVRGETILDTNLVGRAPLTTSRDHELAELARLGPKGVHKAMVKRVKDQAPTQWAMSAEALDRDKDLILAFIDAREEA